jgi:hypothetical protein
LHKNAEHSYYLIFSTIHDVLKAEKRLKEHGLRFELMPIPRNLSSDCGSCIRLFDEIETAMECMGSIKIERRFLHKGNEFTPLP